MEISLKMSIEKIDQFTSILANDLLIRYLYLITVVQDSAKLGSPSCRNGSVNQGMLVNHQKIIQIMNTLMFVANARELRA